MMTAAALAAGFLLDCIFGDPHTKYHPVCLIGNLIAWLEKKLRKQFKTTKTGELTAGGILVVLVLAVTGFIPAGLLWLANLWSPAAKFVLEAFMFYTILAAHSLCKESMNVYNALKTEDISNARYAVSMIVGRDTAKLDRVGVTKAAVETVAENTSDGVIAPMIYCAIGGPVLGYLYKAVNTMDSMIAYKNDKYRYFGRIAAYLDDIANFIPARISALLMIVCSIITGGSVRNAAYIFIRDRYKHASPNSAQTESVCAGALRIQLAGDAWYHGELCRKDFIGDPLRPVEIADIKRANRLMYAATVLCLCICIGVRVYL